MKGLGFKGIQARESLMSNSFDDARLLYPAVASSTQTTFEPLGCSCQVMGSPDYLV